MNVNACQRGGSRILLSAVWQPLLSRWASVTECAAEAIIPGKTCTFRSVFFFPFFFLPRPCRLVPRSRYRCLTLSHHIFFFFVAPLAEDHKWLNARLHLFDSPAGAFITPFIPSASSAATIVFTAPLWPAAPPSKPPTPDSCSHVQPLVLPFSHCYFRGLQKMSVALTSAPVK